MHQPASCASTFPLIHSFNQSITKRIARLRVRGQLMSLHSLPIYLSIERARPPPILVYPQGGIARRNTTHIISLCTHTSTRSLRKVSDKLANKFSEESLAETAA
eukprot:GHVU01098559.1.p2 GENE.GHVU01098559.1~~GHVU01098559.1.p2  ORF type:complete len:104 (+),score=1.31 GHVU01098559.1:448-759(+)